MLQLYVYVSTLTVVYRGERVFKSNGQINRMHKNTRAEPDWPVCFDSMTAVSIWIIEHTLYDTRCRLQQMARLILCQPKTLGSLKPELLAHCVRFRLQPLQG